MVCPAIPAEIVADVVDDVLTVFTVNVAEVRPAGIVTFVGTVAPVRLLLKAIVSPPVGATPLILTVPVEVLPPTTVAGLSVTETSVGALIVKLASAEKEPVVPVIVATVCVATAVV